MKHELLRAAWAALENCTPMQTDCGALCSAACCAPDDDGLGGVALLPGEIEMMGEMNWAALSQDDGMDAPMILCHAHCEREYRPFLCRIFPLCPCLDKQGRWTVRMDARARAVCPLSGHGLRGLDPAFVKNAARAVRILAKDSEYEAFLRRWSMIESEFRKPIF